MIHPDRSDPTEDLFAETRMPFPDHLEELRWHLGRALAGFAAIVLFSFVLDGVGYLTDTGIGVGRPVMGLVARPVEQALQQLHQRRKERALRAAEKADEAKVVELEVDLRALAHHLGLPAERLAAAERPYFRLPARIPSRVWITAVDETLQLISDPPSLKTLGATEAMMVYFKVAAVCGIVLGSPWIFWQLWSFVAAGLYPHEKRLVHVYLPFSVGLFLAGVAFCQLLVMPRAVEALLWFNEWLGFQPDLRLSEWISFAVWMPVVFGLSFQTPLVMRLTARLGVMTVPLYRRNRRLAWFVMALVAAVLTPTMDAVGLLLLWLPMGLLYELGIVMCRLSPGESDVPEPEDLVEV